MISFSKQLHFSPMQNTNNSNQTGVPTSNNSINTNEFQCHPMIDSVPESLKSYLCENLGTLKYDLRENLRIDHRKEMNTAIEQIELDRLSLGDKDSYYGPLGGDNPPSPSNRSSFSHNIAALVDKGGNDSNGKEVVPNPDMESNQKQRNPGNGDRSKG